MNHMWAVNQMVSLFYEPKFTFHVRLRFTFNVRLRGIAILRRTRVIG